MKVLKDIKELLEEELKDIKKKGSLSPAELENVHKAVETIKYIDEICGDKMMPEMEDEGYSGYSMRHGRMTGHYTPLIEDHSYDYQPRYSYSGRRRYSGCNDTGRLYSREGATSNMISRLEDMMDSACTEHEREAIASCINKLM